MRVLVLGGTSFLGARTVEAALARGHEVTIFTRGKTRPERFGSEPRVTALVGDRDPEVGAGLTALESPALEYDAVLDVSGYLPRHVRASAELLAARTQTYLFISSISAYAAPVPAGADEDSALIELEDPTVEEITPETYGGLKVLAERALRDAAGEAALIIRPGIIAGADDFTERFSYWGWAAKQAGDGPLLAPGRPSDPTQVIDASDLGRWLVELSERGAPAVRKEQGHDTFNASGPEGGTTIGALLAASIDAAGGHARPVWVPAAFLAEAGVEPWSDLPLWIPPESDGAGMLAVDSSRAFRAGLRSRPLVETARAALAWLEPRLAEADRDRPLTGLAPERAAQVLLDWDARSQPDAR